MLAMQSMAMQSMDNWEMKIWSYVRVRESRIRERAQGPARPPLLLHEHNFRSTRIPSSYFLIHYSRPWKRLVLLICIVQRPDEARNAPIPAVTTKVFTAKGTQSLTPSFGTHPAGAAASSHLEVFDRSTASCGSEERLIVFALRI